MGSAASSRPNENKQLDITQRYGSRTLKCEENNDKKKESPCLNCEQVICSCVQSPHQGHGSVSVEGAEAPNTDSCESDEMLYAEMFDLESKIQFRINLTKDKIKSVKLSKETIESDKNKLLYDVETLVNNGKKKLQQKFDKIIRTIDERCVSIKNLIIKKTDEESRELEEILSETQTKLLHLQETLSSIEKPALPVSKAAERASFLKETSSSMTQPINKLEVINYYPSHQLSDLSQWRADVNDWFQSLTETLSNTRVLPKINRKDVMNMSRFECF